MPSKHHNPERQRKWVGRSYKKGGERVSALRDVAPEKPVVRGWLVGGTVTVDLDGTPVEATVTRAPRDDDDAWCIKDSDAWVVSIDMEDGRPPMLAVVRAGKVSKDEDDRTRP